MIEREKKFLLTQNEYRILLRHFSSTSYPSTVQRNYYFDTDNLVMNRNGITCRIRYKNGKLEATMKRHCRIIKDFSLEENMKQPNSIESNCFTDIGLKYQGCLTTQRTIILKTEAYELVLDKNNYLDVTDYELEIEYYDSYEKEATQMHEQIIEVLRRNGIGTSHIKQTEKSKSQRFFEKRGVIY